MELSSGNLAWTVPVPVTMVPLVSRLMQPETLSSRDTSVTAPAMTTSIPPRSMARRERRFGPWGTMGRVPARIVPWQWRWELPVILVTGYARNSAGNDDFFTVRLRNSDGVQVWGASFNGPINGRDRAAGLAFNRPGDCDHRSLARFRRERRLLHGEARWRQRFGRLVGQLQWSGK